ncbi:MAG: ABC transporter permease [Clostridium sp.]|jgi:NitT/TauT family transport system permease protein|uniref:ABC transporter permease n=1 Tax=Clostridium sp. TaxID=1506 RepID=UPI0025C30B21|nr:ABC transporter permease [Clostridium sp.]MCH3963713.1 ABC transporter permease [Clostridium sp.]MCI1714854.1 ABC transporter permease [Clostridium sp.]MCI1798957.1 ABC transporter permease [Clostridium sp.]MCI1813037.1 ABC transporter permease [Clostridium sp.]MCI1869927.1 ABC transporter permease [Clostridium sp.]
MTAITAEKESKTKEAKKTKKAKKEFNLASKLAVFSRKSIALIVFFALWEIAPRVGLINEQFIPPISTIAVYLVQMAAAGDLFIHVQASLTRALEGFALAVLVGVPLGFLLGGWFKKFEQILDPLLQVFAKVNPFTLFPIFILFFGIGEVSKVAIILWVALWPVLFQTINGIKNIDPLLIKGARAMATPKFSLFYKVVLPGAAPLIFAGLKSSVGTSFLMLVAAEMIGASKGLGWLILNAENNYNIVRLYAGAITIAALGLFMSKLLTVLEHLIITWKEDTTAV